MPESLRQRFNESLKEAMKGKDDKKVSTIRLINAALKDRDIAARSKGNTDGINSDEILVMLQSMIKQRRESIKMYQDGGRQELADQEANEIKIIESFLPAQLSDDEMATKISEAISETGASSIKDMGSVMNILKEQFAGQMDFGKAAGMIKQKLST